MVDDEKGHNSVTTADTYRRLESSREGQSSEIGTGLDRVRAAADGDGENVVMVVAVVQVERWWRSSRLNTLLSRQQYLRNPLGSQFPSTQRPSSTVNCVNRHKHVDTLGAQ